MIQLLLILGDKFTILFVTVIIRVLYYVQNVSSECFNNSISLRVVRWRLHSLGVISCATRAYNYIIVMSHNILKYNTLDVLCYKSISFKLFGLFSVDSNYVQTFVVLQKSRLLMVFYWSVKSTECVCVFVSPRIFRNHLLVA